MSASIFIRTFENDRPWLTYCLKSIHKYASGFDEVVIAIPEGMTLNLTAERVVHVTDLQPGYHAQQVSKLYADHHTDSENIVYIDADTIFNQPVDASMWFKDGKPVWMMTPFDKVSLDAVAAWFEVMKKFFRVDPQFEFMRRMGQIIPRWAHPALRQYCKKQHGQALADYIMSQPLGAFSEFNVMGMFLHGNHHARIHWHNTETDGVPPSVVSQFFSHGGITPKIRAELEAATA